MKTLCGKLFKVDKPWQEDVKSFSRWHLSAKKYVAGAYRDSSGKLAKVYLHRIICGANSGEQVDHINGDTLDNRRANLRICSVKENTLNKSIRKDSTNGYKGLERRGQLWRARICRDGIRTHLGYFSDQMDAVKAYDEAARRIHGDFARPNFD